MPSIDDNNSTNPYAAPQATAYDAEQAAAARKANETRWHYIEYGFRLGLFVGCCLILYSMVRIGLQYPGYWFLLGLLYTIVIMPLCIAGGILLGSVAAYVDRKFQDYGWRKPYVLIEFED